MKSGNQSLVDDNFFSSLPLFRQLSCSLAAWQLRTMAFGMTWEVGAG
jgi:hypothetical protein